MMNTHTHLSGTRIWLSGSIPKEASEEESARLILFTATLAAECFRAGARLVHGCHPSLMEPLLSAAAAYRESTGRKAPLRLVASVAYQEANGGYAGRSESELHQESDFRVTPISGDKDQSLTRMRDSLAAEADALVAIGGKWWQDAPNHAGVPAEFNLAISRGIPSFLLGGLGGATTGYLEKHPEILNQLRNGLDLRANESLAGEKDVVKLVESVLDQAARLPLGRRETAPGQPFRILSLDGGGIRGAFTAAVLAKWEALTGLSVAKHFDLIAGTSTGGILAIGLGLGLSAQQMVTFYSEHGPTIFPMMNFGQRARRWFRRIWRIKFDAEVLEKTLRLAYGSPDRLLRDSPRRLLITSYNTTSDDLRLYRTSHHPTVSGHDHLSAITVARATSAAPSYFRAATVDDPAAPHEAVDGGVWANCPSLAALTEAVGVLGIPLDRIEMLSVGTTGSPSIVGAPKYLTGLLGWAKRAPDLLMKAQQQATLAQTERLLGTQRFVRVDDAALCDGLDDVRAIPMLINKGAETGEKFFHAVNTRFINGVAAAFWR